jgi:hypothetical protein
LYLGMKTRSEVSCPNEISIYISSEAIFDWHDVGTSDATRELFCAKEHLWRLHLLEQHLTTLGFRHVCKSGDDLKYGWNHHDGVSYGKQEIAGVAFAETNSPWSRSKLSSGPYNQRVEESGWFAW